MKNQRGLTLIELIFSVSVAGILLSVAVPSFVNSINNSEMVTSANVVVSAIHAARSEAVKSRSFVTLCRSDNDKANPSCEADGNDILVFTNASNDNSYDSGTDTIVRELSWLDDDLSAQSATIPNYVSFNSDGVTRSTSGASISGSIVVCGPGGEELARVITISPTGRPTVQKHADATNPPSCPST